MTGAPAAFALQAEPVSAVELLAENLQAAAEIGNVEAAESLVRLAGLNLSDRSELEHILTGDGVLAEATVPHGRIDAVADGVSNSLPSFSPKDQAETTARVGRGISQ